MKRKIAIFLSVVFILVALAVPCFAAEIDFNDYITNEAVSGDDTVVDVSIPVEVFHSIQWRLWNRTNGTWPLLVEGYGTSFTHSYSQSLDYALTVNPFGSDVLDVRDIPDGTVLTFSYTVTGAAYAGDSGIPARIGMSYYDANGTSLGFVNGNFQTGQFLEDNAVSFTLDKPVGCVSVKPALTFDGFNPIGNTTYTITLKSVSFRFSIDSLLKLQQETGRTNKILQNIQQTFDDFINREPEPEAPSFKEPMEDALNKEEDILLELPMAEVLEEFRNKQSLVEDGLIANAAGFTLFTLLWERFFLYCTWYEFVCYFALVIGSVMAFVGITSVFLSRKGGKE